MIGLFKMPAIVDLPIRMKGHSQRSFSTSLNPLGAQNKDIGAASQTLLTDGLNNYCLRPVHASSAGSRPWDKEEAWSLARILDKGGGGGRGAGPPKKVL